MESDQYAQSVMDGLADYMLKGEYRLDHRTFRHYLAMAWLKGKAEGMERMNRIAINAIERKEYVIS